MRAQLEKLIALQKVDLKIKDMERAKEEIPQRVALLEDSLRKLEEKVGSARAELEKLQKERRQKEKELEEEVDRVKKTETRVYEIKTNKEYQAVLKEIETAKKLNRQREEEILGILERAEEMQKSLKAEEQKLGVSRRETEQQIAELKRQEASFDKEMAGEILQKEKQEREIAGDLLVKYHWLLSKRQGVAVARVQNGVCQACNMNLRPQLFIELQKQDSLILCPNCNRILFWKNGSDKAKEP